MQARRPTIASLAILAVVMAACGNGDDAEDLAVDTEDFDCEIEGLDEIRIGGIGALSGAHADYGDQMRMGATIAAEELNEAGGVLGCPIDIRFLDEELDAEVASTHARFLVQDWGADFLVGLDSSASALALASLMDELDRVLVVTHASTEALNEEEIYENDHRNVFRVSVPIYQDAILAAQLFAEELPEATRFANIGADYEFGRTGWAMFQEELTELRDDVEFVGEAWAPLLTTDFDPMIGAVMAEDPDVIFATPWGGEAVQMLRQAVQAGTFDQIDAWWQSMGGSVDALEGLEAEVQDGQFQDKLYGTGRALFNWPESAENEAWVETFQDRWDRMPNYSATATYTAVGALAEAVEETGDVETDEIVSAMQGMEIDDSPLGDFHFREEDHQGVYNVAAGRVAYSEEWDMPCICEDLFIVEAEDYYRHPPFD